MYGSQIVNYLNCTKKRTSIKKPYAPTGTEKHGDDDEACVFFFFVRFVVVVVAVFPFLAFFPVYADVMPPVLNLDPTWKSKSYRTQRIFPPLIKKAAKTEWVHWDYCLYYFWKIIW